MELDLILKIGGVGLLVAVLHQVLSRSGRDEYAMLTVLAGVLVVLAMLLPKLSALYAQVRAVFGL